MATANLTKPKAEMTLNDWASVLSKAGRGIPDQVPPGFKLAEDIARETGRGLSQTGKYLREARRLGLVEEQKFKVDTGTKLYPTPHYRIIPQNENDPCRAKTQK
jgi:hypothetical protein